jgi:hypothetical protein
MVKAAGYFPPFDNVLRYGTPSILMGVVDSYLDPSRLAFHIECI